MLSTDGVNLLTPLELGGFGLASVERDRFSVGWIMNRNTKRIPLSAWKENRFDLVIRRRASRQRQDRLRRLNLRRTELSGEFSRWMPHRASLRGMPFSRKPKYENLETIGVLPFRWRRALFSSLGCEG